ncbi:MAG: tRNA uridine(34) 5-carboxymethylaminomethyl modification radical SAM/GNAT enzyme Elp3 [Dehalococcoidia bacterium]|nr:tRNA uridine(34) 5-carboxymethylaminomethyl modification radical SAM/GNAT enzyme Elp3 [Dehalococcoidia bacterium]
MKKASRTISGVTPVAVMAKPFPCPGKCVYCPSSPEAPKSYTAESPAVLRARSCGFDAKKQVEIRLKTLAEMGHARDKVELIVMGGTFLYYPQDYQYQFIKDCYDALTGITSSSLQEAKKLNENTEHRCVGLCIETRPDFCGEEEIRRMLDFGTTRVELGVQTLDDEIHCLTKRGHGVAEVISATRLLRDRGFKVYYHWMPGLPGSTPEHDLELSRQLFEDARFRPDGLKLYPTLVVRGSELETWYRDNRYQPYCDEVMIDSLVAIKILIPKYVRISRLMRDIPSKFIIAGSRDLALRGTIRKKMEQAGVRCNCIRCREYGHRRRDGWLIGGPQLTRLDYETLGGKEIFLSYEDENETLFGLLRLRVNEEKAIVRELHIFGPEVPLGTRLEQGAQHHGLGERLVREAERIAREESKADRLSVLSGVGAREYYRSLGYRLEGAYMVKEFG